MTPQPKGSPKPIARSCFRRGRARLGLRGVYAAWMTRPEFRSFAQPQIARALTMAGKPSPIQARAAAPVAAKPDAPPTPAPADAMTSADAAATPEPAVTQTAAATPAAAGSQRQTHTRHPAPPPMQTKVATPAQSAAPASAAAIMPAKTTETVKPVAVQNTVAPHTRRPGSHRLLTPRPPSTIPKSSFPQRALKRD